MSRKLLDELIAGLSEPANVLAAMAGPDAIKSRLRTGVSPLVIASDWFANPSYDLETQKLALEGLMQVVRRTEINPDHPVLACGTHSLLAAATALLRYDAILELIELGADPLILVDPVHPNPRARTLVGNALSKARSRPSEWLSLYTAFGSFADTFSYQLGHFQLRAELELHDPYADTL